MTTDQWNSLGPFILEAFEKPPRGRSAYLEEKLKEEPELLYYAHRILRLVERTGENQKLPDVISGWRILLPIGCDDLGMDYLATRADGSMEPLMNFKVARIRLEDAATQQKFVEEMRVLTMLYDSNIARIVDAGWVTQGHPFVVSEFEGGVPVTEVALNMDLKENLTVFLRLLTAVGYAHQRKIIHGDLRPANVLLTPDRVPRLVDFGLARVFAKGGDAVAALKEMDAESLAYFSPEQIRGKDLTEASDVYALGVILYEMLAGKPPYGKPSDSVIERGRAICESIPPRIDGADDDVNYIVGKALEKNMEARYSSVVAMSADIEAYLDGRSVMPRREALAEYFVRTLRQNWITVALVVAVLGVAALAFFQRSKQEEKNSPLQKIAGDLFQNQTTGAKNGSGVSSVESARIYLDGMVKQNAGKPEVEGELARAYLRLAEVELKGSGVLPGDRGAAIRSARKALELSSKLVVKDAKSDTELLEYARSAKMLSELLQEARDYKEAIRITQEWKDKLASASSQDPEIRKALATADERMADLMFASGDRQAAMPAARSAMQQFGAIFESDKGDPSKARDYARSANNAGSKALSLNFLSEALTMFRTAETTMRPVASKPDSEVGPLLDLAKTLSGLGETLEKTKQGDQARASYREARQLLEQAAQREKNNPDAIEGLAEILMKTAKLNRDTGSVGAAAQDIEVAVVKLRNLVGNAVNNAEQRRQLALALTLRGEIARAQRRVAIAQESFEEAIAAWNYYERMAGLRPEDQAEIARLKSLAGR